MELLAIQWWNWPVDKITRNLKAIVGAEIANLKSAE
jgi:virginiamycin A acetyltransferase